VTESAGRVDGFSGITTVLAARRYFVDGASKTEIAGELGISRFKVARLLQDALRDGVVRIEIDAVPEVDEVLSRELAVATGIRSAVVVRSDEGSRSLPGAALSRAGAMVLAEGLVEEDILGISWGRTLHAMVGRLPPLPACTVVQLVGSVPSLELDVNSTELVRRLAERAGGRVYPLHAPLILQSVDIAEALRSDPSLRQTLAMFPRVTRAIVGIGAWVEGESTVRAALSAEDGSAIEAAGAIADVCGIPLDRDGREVLAAGLAERRIAISALQLRALPDVVAISAGARKVVAIGAALRSGLVHRLITNDVTARGLIAGASTRRGDPTP
jgi:DNA-binding transcriptional regulator LsrR (DeoR family)